MKKLFFILLFALNAHGQTAFRTATADLSTARGLTSQAINLAGTSVSVHQVVVSVYGGTLSACSLEVQSASTNATSTTWTTESTLDCTGTRNSGYLTFAANFTRNKAVTFTAATGTPVITVNYSGYISVPSNISGIQAADAGVGSLAQQFIALSDNYVYSVDYAGGSAGAFGLFTGIEDSTVGSGKIFYGFGALSIFDGTSDALNKQHIGAGLQCSVTGSGALNNCYGVDAEAVMESGSGNVGVLTAGYFRIQNLSASSSITGRGIHVESTINSGGGGLFTNIGIDVEAQTAGIANYAIITRGATLSRFTGGVELGSGTVSSTGTLRLPAVSTIYARNTADDANKTLATFGVAGPDIFTYGDSSLVTIVTGSSVIENVAGNSIGTWSAGGLTLATGMGLFVGTTTLINSTVNLSDGAGGGTGTLTNAPASTNPTKWIPINDNGTTRYVPAW